MLGLQANFAAAMEVSITGRLFHYHLVRLHHFSRLAYFHRYG